MNESLRRPYEAYEVTKALFQMYPLKSPGPDGMSLIFYQKFWHIVGDSVTKIVLPFLKKGQFLKSINYTHIVLIPKCRFSESITQFRHISLCNMIYKLASKVLANRMRSILPQIISDFQSAFVPRRLITNDVLVAYEIHHFLKTKKKEAKRVLCLFKLDE